MISLVTTEKAKMIIAENTRACRLQMELTQEGLAKRSGVPLPTLRKFEQKGVISLESFLKIQMVLDGLDDIIKSTQIKNSSFLSIDDVLETNNIPARKRGVHK